MPPEADASEPVRAEPAAETEAEVESEALGAEGTDEADDVEGEGEKTPADEVAQLKRKLAALAVEKLNRDLRLSWKEERKARAAHLLRVNAELKASAQRLREREHLESRKRRAETRVAAVWAVGAILRKKNKCSGCEKNSETLRACTRCRAVSYCDQSCQAQHWAVHQKGCWGAKARCAPTDETWKTLQQMAVKGTAEGELRESSEDGGEKETVDEDADPDMDSGEEPLDPETIYELNLGMGGVLNRSKRKKGVTRVCAALDVPYVQTVAVGPSQRIRLNTLLDSGAGPVLINANRPRAKELKETAGLNFERAQYAWELGSFDKRHPGVRPQWEMKIPITLDGVTGAVRALVVENLAVDLLLGREGLTQLGVVLDFGTQTYEVRGPGGARTPTETKQIPFKTRRVVGAVTQTRYALRTTASVMLQPMCDSTVPVEVVDRSGERVRLPILGVTGRLREIEEAGIFLVRVNEDGPTMVHVRSLNAHGVIQRGSLVGFIHPINEQENAVVEFGNPLSDGKGSPQAAPVQPEEERKEAAAGASGPRLSAVEQRAQLDKVLGKFQDVYAQGSRPGKTQGAELAIDTGTAAPVNWRMRRLSQRDEQILRDYVKEMLDAGVIESSTSPWSAPVLIVPKKKPGEWRVAIDYRGLNKVTKPMLFPIPRMDEIWDRLAGSRYFTTLDQCAACHAVPIREMDQEKTAFSTPWGKFQYKTMPFGLSGAPACLSQYMASVLGDIRSCVAYMDDILIATADWDSHMRVLSMVLEKLREAGVKLNGSKC